MNTEQLALFLLIGLVAGWLASRITRGRGFGLVGDLVVGVIGSLVTAVIGASVLLYLLRIIKKA